MKVDVVVRNQAGETEARKKLGREGVAAMDQQGTWSDKARIGEQYLGSVQRMEESPAATVLAAAALKTSDSDGIGKYGACRATLNTLSGSLADRSVEHLLAETALKAVTAVAINYQGTAAKAFLEAMVAVAPGSRYAEASRAALGVRSSEAATHGAAAQATTAALAACPSGPVTQMLAQIAIKAMDQLGTWQIKSEAVKPFLEVIAEHDEDWARSQVATAALTQDSSDGITRYGTYRGALNLLAGDVNGTADQALADAAERARVLVAPAYALGSVKPFLNAIPRS